MDASQVPEYAGYLKSVVEGFRSLLGLVKDIKDILPEGEKKRAIEKSVTETEKAITLAELEIARSLGFALCQCQFPPIIMLSTEVDEWNVQTFECPACKATCRIQKAPEI